MSQTYSNNYMIPSLSIFTQIICGTSSTIAYLALHSFVFFFFQAEDGIRDDLVTGVQTCALPIYAVEARDRRQLLDGAGGLGPRPRAGLRRAQAFRCGGGELRLAGAVPYGRHYEIGRASCRERV